MEMVGKRMSRSSLICDSRQRRTLYVPLPFWFTQHSGQALSLASLQFHGVQVKNVGLKQEVADSQESLEIAKRRDAMILPSRPGRRSRCAEDAPKWRQVVRCATATT